MAIGRNMEARKKKKSQRDRESETKQPYKESIPSWN
jgi:hypothetical protein